MKCPVDDETLLITERNGVEIDYCPKCRGIWLDRGELDKVIERTESEVASMRETSSRPRGDDHRHGTYRKKKKESFLGELFDF